jgi:purine nucleosidase
MRNFNLFLFLSVFTLGIFSCTNEKPSSNDKQIPILIDTDANNELDDQHALAYAFANPDVFKIVGITVNNTINGEGIEGHYEEALRIARLFKVENLYPIKKGAVAGFKDIEPNLDEPLFDGAEAVNFIIEKAHEKRNEKLVLVPIGKLTNIALALEKDPSIVEKVKVVWLGSNYPDPGEYNLVNDPGSVNPVIQSGVEFEMVLVAYGRDDGTAAVTVPISEIEEKMPGLGPEIEEAIEGRNGGTFINFGDYAINLWQNIDKYGEMQVRSLFDLAAIAIIKNPDWSKAELIKAPVLENGNWIDNPESDKEIVLHRYFDKEEILSDFYKSIEFVK